MQTEDRDIIRECLDGRPQAFGLLVDKYKEGIYAFVYADLGNFQDAQDVTQEVFLQAYRDLRSLRRWESFVFWLYRIARRRCMDCLRIRSRRVDRESIEDQDPRVLETLSIDSYRGNQLSESVREALDSLPDTYREVLVLYYFAGLNSVDIARSLGTSPTAIRHRLSRARARLKEEMVTMMDTAFERQRLPEGFTFRIVEAVKRIKIQPMPRSAGLPWGLSLAAGVMLVAMTIGSQLAIRQQSEPLAFSREMTVPEAREMAVDILGAPGTSGMAGKQGDTDGAGIDPRNPQNKFLLAPAKGGGTWTQKADMPTARFSSASAVVDGKIYVIGGAPVYLGTTAAVEEYDPAADTWTRRADMPSARAGLAAVAVDGIIYAIGGGESNVEAYDPVTDTWTRKADMLTARNNAGSAVVDGIIYVIGGDAGRVLSAVEAYDPATDTWTTKADMPTARYFLAACVMDGRIYVSGGATKREGIALGTWGSVPTVEVYDPATDTWTQAPNMPSARIFHSASVVAGKMYIVGGTPDGLNRGENIEISKTVDVYDPATDTWTTAAGFPTEIATHTADVVDGKIYTIGGCFIDDPLPFSTVYEFDSGLPDSISVTGPAGKLLRTWGEVKSQ